MSMERGLFVTQLANGQGTSALSARRALAGMFEEDAPGVPRSGVLDSGTPLAVTGTANMTYNLAALKFVISRAAGEGVYAFSSLGVSNVGTDPAPGADSRWDIIYVRQNDPDKNDLDSNGENSNQAILGVVVGLSAASPTPPEAALPAGAMEVARARVYAGATGTNQGAGRVEIEQRFKYTALRGTPIPVRNATERPTSPRLRQTILTLGTGVTEQWDGDSWEPATKREHSEWLLLNWQANGGPVQDIPFRNRDAFRSTQDSFVQLVPNTNGRFEVFQEGIYALSMHVELGFASEAGTFMAFLHGNSAETLQTVDLPLASGGYSLAFPNLYLKPGVPGNSSPGGIVLVRLRLPNTRTITSVRFRMTRLN